MASLLKSLSIGFTSLTVFASQAIYTSQAHAQHSECLPSDDDRDWAHISTYMDEGCELESFIKTSEEKPQAGKAEEDANQDNHASRSLDRRKTNNSDEDGVQHEADERYAEPVDWRWEGKDKF